jgi:hypothetical protein
MLDILLFPLFILKKVFLSLPAGIVEALMYRQQIRCYNHSCRSLVSIPVCSELSLFDRQLVPYMMQLLVDWHELRKPRHEVTIFTDHPGIVAADTFNRDFGGKLLCFFREEEDNFPYPYADNQIKLYYFRLTGNEEDSYFGRYRNRFHKTALECYPQLSQSGFILVGIYYWDGINFPGERRHLLLHGNEQHLTLLTDEFRL